MKKLFYMLLAAVMCFGFVSCGDEKAEEVVALADQLAASYTGDLTVTIDSESVKPTKEKVTITRVDDTHIDFALNDFKLSDEETELPVGTIEIKGLELKEGANGMVEFSMTKNITIASGSAGEEWIGPLLGEVPVKLVGKANKSTMDIDIDIEMLEQIIHVDFVSK